MVADPQSDQVQEQPAALPQELRDELRHELDHEIHGGGLPSDLGGDSAAGDGDSATAGTASANSDGAGSGDVAPEAPADPDAPEELPQLQRPRVHIATEVAGWFLLLFGLEYWISDSFGYVGIEPSPLWLPVLWAAARNGLFAGLATALVAALLQALGYGAIAGLDWYLLVTPPVTWPLALFVVVAFVIGQMRDTIDADRQHARHRAEQLRRDVMSRQADLDLLRHVNRELKRRIFDRSFDFQSVMSSVARTSDSDEKVFDVPLGMLVDFCGATKCSALYLLPGGVIDLAAHRGWTDEEMQPRLRSAQHNQRILRAIAEARPIVTLSDDDVQQGGVLLVAPLADATGAIKSLLCIDELPPARFDQNTVRTFLGIASWVANNMRRIEVGGTDEETWQSAMQMLNASKTIGTSEQLSQRIFLEDARRARYGVESVLIAMRLLDPRSSMSEYVETLEEFVSGVLSSSTRLSDDGFRFGFAGCYVIVLTGCGSDSAEDVTDRLRERFGAISSEELGPVDLQVFATSQQAPKLESLLPLITLHFFGPPPPGIEQRCPVPEPSQQRTGNARDFVQRLRLEIDLSDRQHWDLHLVDFHGDERNFGIGPMMARHLWNLAGTMLRVTDGIYVLGPSRCVVLLPCTSSLDATRIWQRLDESLSQSIPNERYEAVKTEFLALSDTDARDALMHLIGSQESAAPAQPNGGPILSQVELDHLSFSEREFADIHEAFDFQFPDASANEAEQQPPSPPEPTSPSTDEAAFDWTLDEATAAAVADAAEAVDGLPGVDSIADDEVEPAQARAELALPGAASDPEPSPPAASMAANEHSQLSAPPVVGPQLRDELDSAVLHMRAIADELRAELQATLAAMAAQDAAPAPAEATAEDTAGSIDPLIEVDGVGDMQNDDRRAAAGGSRSAIQPNGGADASSPGAPLFGVHRRRGAGATG